MLKVKGLSAVVIVMLAGCMLQACNNHKPQNYNMATDTDGDTSPDTSVKLKIVVDQHDQDFAAEAINGGITEVALGRLAVKNGKSKEVKNFGQMMIKDHSKANRQLLLLMKVKNINATETPDSTNQALIDNLSAKSGTDFDKAYIACMINDHQKTLKFFTDESKQLQDPELKNFAIKTLPVLKNHLEEISSIHLIEAK
jgi:putative membrane protein